MKRPLTVLLVLGLLGCSAREQPGPIETGPRELGRVTFPDRGVVSQQCAPVSPPESMPSLRRLARPGTTGNLALLTSDLTPADSIELSVRYDDEGRLDWVRTLASTLPPGRAGPIEELIRGALMDDLEPGWGFRLRITGGGEVTVRPSVVCLPQIRENRRQLRVDPTGTLPRSVLGHTQALRVDLRITINRRGRVTHVQLQRSTGSSSVDQRLIEWVMDLDFFPMLHDGIPVRTTIARWIRIGGRR